MATFTECVNYPDGFPYTDHTLLVFNLLGNFFERGLGVSVVFSGPFPPFCLVLVRGFLVSLRYFRFLDQFNPFYILCSKAVCEPGERFRLLPGMFQQAQESQDLLRRDMLDSFEETHSFQAAGIKITYNVIKKILCGSVVGELFIINKQLVIGDFERQ